MKTFGEKLLRSTSPSDHEWNVMSTHSAGYVLKYSILFIAFRKKKIIQSLAKRPGRIYLFLWQKWVAVLLIKFDWVFAIWSIVIKSVVVLSNVYVDEIALIA